MKEEKGLQVLPKLTIDFKQLREQKLWLANQGGEAAEGLLSLLDSIQDQAVDAGIPEQEVFDETLEETPRSLPEYMLKLDEDGYPGGIGQYVNTAGKYNGREGDTLAVFVVRELSENFNPDLSFKDNLEVSEGVIDTAITDLEMTKAGIEMCRLRQRVDGGDDE